jgi:hypothetical protein
MVVIVMSGSTAFFACWEAPFRRPFAVVEVSICTIPTLRKQSSCQICLIYESGLDARKSGPMCALPQQAIVLMFDRERTSSQKLTVVANEWTPDLKPAREEHSMRCVYYRVRPSRWIYRRSISRDGVEGYYCDD